MTGTTRNDFPVGDFSVGQGFFDDQLELSVGGVGPGVFMGVFADDVNAQLLTSDAWPTDVAAALSAAPFKFFSIGNLLADNTAVGIGSATL